MRGRGGHGGPDNSSGFNPREHGEYADPRYRTLELNKSRRIAERTGEINAQSNQSNCFENNGQNPARQNNHGMQNNRERPNNFGPPNRLNGPRGNRPPHDELDECVDPRYRNRIGRTSGLSGSMGPGRQNGMGPGGFGGPSGQNGPDTPNGSDGFEGPDEQNGPGGFEGPGRQNGPGGPDGQNIPGGPGDFGGHGRPGKLGGRGGRRGHRGFHGKGRRDYIFKKIKGQKHFKFNPFHASSWSQSGQQSFQESELPVNDFTKEEFIELRTNNTESSALEQLNEIATELKSTNKDSIKSVSRACLICCNNYTKPSYKLGVGPINDSVTVAANHKYLGYNVYFLHNPKSTLFLEYLKLFLQKTTDYLTVYYTGHGSSVSDKHSDEDDQKDEVMIFDDDYVLDDTLSDILTKNANGKTKVILINDCCHSGTMYDIPTDMDEAEKLPANIICISAADDDETAKQGQQNSNDQGFFTFFFFQEVRRNGAITPEEIMNNVSSQLKTYDQCVVSSPTREELMTTPLFPQ